MFCIRCGTQLPDNAKFCSNCGAAIGTAGVSGEAGTQPAAQAAQPKAVIAPVGIAALNCPRCGAPIAPKFGEMVITCAYCGSGISLGADGWRSLQKQSMLPLRLPKEDDAIARIKEQMDRGLLRRHLEEQSTREELTLSYIPYWLIPVSARTSIVAADVAAEVGTIATEAALIGILGGAMGGRRRGFGMGGAMAGGALMGTAMGGSANLKKAATLALNYEYPVVAVKALQEYQPMGYEFALKERTIFDITTLPKPIKVLNGDVSEEAAKHQAKAYVDTLQAQAAHQKYHMIQQMSTEMDVSDGELMYVPVWFARYLHKGGRIVLVIDGNSGGVINSIGL